MRGATAGVVLSLVLSLGVSPHTTAQQGTVPDTREQPTAASVADLLDEAEAWRTRATALDAEWLETRSLIDKARQAAANQNWRDANELAAKAKKQGELAVAQAKREADAWRHRVVH